MEQPVYWKGNDEEEELSFRDSIIQQISQQ
jgi:hypothetical protein